MHKWQAIKYGNLSYGLYLSLQHTSNDVFHSVFYNISAFVALMIDHLAFALICKRALSFSFSANGSLVASVSPLWGFIGWRAKYHRLTQACVVLPIFNCCYCVVACNHVNGFCGKRAYFSLFGFCAKLIFLSSHLWWRCVVCSRSFLYKEPIYRHICTWTNMQLTFVPWGAETANANHCRR